MARRVAPEKKRRRTPASTTRRGPSKTIASTQASSSHRTRLPGVTTVAFHSSHTPLSSGRPITTLNSGSGNRAPAGTAWARRAISTTASARRWAG
ncbi:MAG: hypothetical protein M3179_12300, partial [Actinomycetota bacterium]|nr:hypothetical protein [Actinomycetota bacterium]